MEKSRLRLMDFINPRRNATQEGVGQALRDAFSLDAEDAHEVRRMEELIEKLKQIEGEDTCQKRAQG